MPYWLDTGDGPERIESGRELDRRSGVPGLSRLLTTLVSAALERGLCPACGWTREQWTTSGLLGCGVCYAVFAPDLAAAGYRPESPNRTPGASG